MVEFWGEDLMGWQRVWMGKPWKEDLWSRKDGLGFEVREEIRVVAMDAISSLYLEFL